MTVIFSFKYQTFIFLTINSRLRQHSSRQAPRYLLREHHSLRCCLRLQRIPLKITPMKAVFVAPQQVFRRSKDLLKIQGPKTECLDLDYRRGGT